MIKTFKYRLYPSKSQETKLKTVLSQCSWLYNYFLEERVKVWEKEKRSIGYCEQATSLPKLKKTFPQLNLVYSSCLQNVATRVDLAFQAFFRRVKRGEKPGFPRFRSYKRYDSFTFPQYNNGCKIQNGKLDISKIGLINMIYHRELQGKPRCLSVKREGEKWFVIVCCEIACLSKVKSDKSIGIDVGLESFATFSDGQKIPNPRFFQVSQKKLVKLQRKFQDNRPTPKQRKSLNKIHSKIKNRRNNFIHQESRKIINRYDNVSVENLDINTLKEKHWLGKQISDAAWRMFTNLLVYKAEEAGKQVNLVNPAYTSQDCSSCGYRVMKKLNQRVHSCPHCGLVVDRDINAAKNILTLGLQSLVVSERNQSRSPR